MILGISGTNSSGKDTVAKYIEEKGFFHISLSDILREEMKKENINITRNKMINFSNNFGLKNGADILARSAIKQFGHKHKLVISSIRKVAEVNFLHSLPNFKLIFVDLSIKIRYERMQKRSREGEDMLSFDRFKKLQEKEMSGINSQNLSYCKNNADFQIDNSGTLEDLFLKVDEIFE